MSSPIEMMIDKACGISVTTPVGPNKAHDAAGAALLEIADAEKRWDRNHKKGTKRLSAAVAAWRAIGG